MKTVTITFGTDENDGEDYVTAKARRALSVDRVYQALEDIRNEVFRPARKHGYADEAISSLVSKIDAKFEGEAPAEELIGLLEEKFFGILTDHGIQL